MSDPTWLLYGANGFTGELLAKEAVHRGHRPTLAGRSREKLEPLARSLGLPFAVAPLDDPAALKRAVDGHALVLHAAGPFVHTALPMLRACLDAKAHCLDITGEVPVFEQSFAHDAEAKAAGIAVISGVGFDVVPTDCLAVHVAEKLEAPTELELAISTHGRPSGGTLRSSIEALPRGGFVRRDGTLRSWPLGKGAVSLRFPHGLKRAVPIPWGDLVTAFHSTGIPNITTYLTLPPSQVRMLQVFGRAIPTLLASDWLRSRALRRVEQAGSGPDDAARDAGRAFIWARARNAKNVYAEAWLETVDGYDFTALAGIRAVEQTLARSPKGALTPAQAFGKDFVLEIPGTRRMDTLS